MQLLHFLVEVLETEHDLTCFRVEDGVLEPLELRVAGDAGVVVLLLDQQQVLVVMPNVENVHDHAFFLVLQLLLQARFDWYWNQIFSVPGVDLQTAAFLSSACFVSGVVVFIISEDNALAAVRVGVLLIVIVISVFVVLSDNAYAFLVLTQLESHLAVLGVVELGVVLEGDLLVPFNLASGRDPVLN